MAAERPTVDYATEAANIAEVLRRFDEVMSAPENEFSTAEKNGPLSKFIRAIYPEGDGYSLELRLSKSASSLGSQQMISTHCPPGASR